MPRRLLLSAATGSGSLAAPVHVYYVAHWDDDGLWMDLDMANQHISGNTIHNVVLTDMTTDLVYPLLTGSGGVCPIHSVTHAFSMTLGQFTSYRDAEGLANATDLGGHQHIPSDRPASDSLTNAYCQGIITQYENLYGPVHHTMSWHDTHPDHAASGAALRDLVDAGTVPSARAVFHIRQELQSTYTGTMVTGLTGASALATTGMTEYTVYNPGSNRYAIGYHGVKSLFDAELAGPFNKTHTSAQNRP
jgi:hypothetical protein